MIDASRPTVEALDKLDEYLVDPRPGPVSPRAPRFVKAVVASLVDPAAIQAAVATYQAGTSQPTVWRVHAVTDRSLAFAEVEFNDDFYTADEENDRSRYKVAMPEAVLREAWVRPLAAIVEYAVDGVRLLSDTGQRAVAAKVRFRDVDTAVELPSQLRSYHDDQLSRSNKLLGHIRDAVGRNGHI